MVRPTSKTTLTMIIAREPLPKRRRTIVQSLLLAQAFQRYIVSIHRNQMRTPMHLSMGKERSSCPVGLLGSAQGQSRCFARTAVKSRGLWRKATITDRFLFRLYGRTSGTGEARVGPMHLAAPDQGPHAVERCGATQIPVAVGEAFANLRLGRKGAYGRGFSADGAADAGVFWESINRPSVPVP